MGSMGIPRSYISVLREIPKSFLESKYVDPYCLWVINPSSELCLQLLAPVLKRLQGCWGCPQSDGSNISSFQRSPWSLGNDFAIIVE